METVFGCLVVGFFLLSVEPNEQKCAINDMRMLVITVNKAIAELKEYKEKNSAAVREKLSELERLELITSLVQNQTETLDKKIQQAATQTNETMSAIQTRLSELNTSVHQLRSASKAQAIEINETLQESTDGIRESLRSQTNEIEILKALANSTTELTNALNATVMINSNRITGLINIVNTIFKNHSDALEALQKVQGMNSKLAVGFRAKSTHTGFYCSNSPIPFDTVDFDSGGAFNNSGYFTAPYSAIYFFSAHICHTQDRVYFDITSRTRGAFTKSYDYANECESMTTVAYLLKGEEVFVNCTHRSYVDTDELNYWTIFSGALLQ